MERPTALLADNEVFVFPLSFAQQRLWVLDRLEPNSTVYNIPIPVRLTGPLNIGALEQALSEVVRRHEILRATFELENGSPVQVIHAPAPVTIPLTDLSSLAEERRLAEARELALNDAQAPFDLSRGPLLRASLLKLSDQDHVLLLTIHHIVFDGWSGQILFREVMAAYNSFHDRGPLSLPPLPLQYSDYAVWQREYLSGDRLQEQVSYWKKQLSGVPDALHLPTDYPRPARQTFRGSKASMVLPSSLLAGLQQLSRQEGVTLFMTLLAVFTVLLGRYSGQDDIVVGSPVTGRNRIELENLIGFFVNSLVLRCDLSGNPSFRQLLARVRETALSAYAHQELPFEKLVEELKPDRDLSRNPVFQVMFAFQTARPARDSASHLTSTPFQHADRAASKFDLTVTATEQGEHLRLAFEYSTDLFHAATIARMQQHFGNLIEGIVASPDQLISDLPLMSREEREQIVFGWNHTAADYDRTLCLHTAFEHQAAKTPEQIAILFEGNRLLYRELNQRANQLANYLIAKGIQPGALVGICLERSPEMITAVLAVLKTGGAYLPLDASYPAHRLAYVLQDSQAQAVISNQEAKNKLPPTASGLILLDTDADAIAKESSHNPSLPVASDSRAYVLYTSGSTGNPKGVEGTHRASINRCAWMWKKYPFEPGETCCQKTTLGFVDSVWEIFGPLLQGVACVIIPQEKVLDPEQFIRVLAEHDVRRLLVVPSQLHTLLQFGRNLRRRLPKLNLWTVSGEVLPVDVAQRFFAILPGARMLNVYGSSETAGDATWHEVTTEDTVSIPIGRPLDNTQVYVLDRYMHPVPVGVVGQIYIGGDCLARGYWNRPQLAAERFIVNPFAPQLSPRLYSMGDLGRYLPDGRLLYWGRIDQQVKIRGHRIELGEIESVLGSHKSVQQAAVVLRELGGEQRLVAYVVLKPSEEISITELRSHLEQLLPAFMIPATFMLLDRFPMTTSGKVNRLALPTPEKSENAAAVAPRDEVEAKLVQIWQNILGLAKIGINENFFELGGHSLLAVRLVSEIWKETGQEIPLAALFQGATIGHLAKIVREARKLGHGMVAAVQAKGSKPPFFGVVAPGANPLGYVALSRHLGEDQPLYEIQGPGPRLRRPYTSKEFEELAAEYIRAMQAIQPRGPYYFGGMCEGARIAFDMARLLEKEDEKVGLLAILDTWVLENSQNRFLWKVDYYSTRLTRFWRGSREYKWQVLRQWAENRYGPTRPELLWPRAYWPGKDFVPAVYSGKITVFKVPKQPYFYINDPLMGWGTRTTAGVEIQLISSKHMRLLREPYVQDLAKKLSACLGRAQREQAEGCDQGPHLVEKAMVLCATRESMGTAGGYFG